MIAFMDIRFLASVACVLSSVGCSSSLEGVVLLTRNTMSAKACDVYFSFPNEIQIVNCTEVILGHSDHSAHSEIRTQHVRTTYNGGATDGH